MARRAAIRNQHSIIIRASQRDMRLGLAALAMPRRFVAVMTAAISLAAAVGVVGTIGLVG
jgi:hypothetical protein